MPRTLVSPKPTSPRSQSADKLDFYPPVKDRIAQAQATMKPNEKRLSPGSISRRNSAPLLSSPKKPRVKPIDTSSTSISYHRPGLTPASRLTSPVGQLSTFGTVYIPSWDNSRSGSATSVPRPSTAPLPTDSGVSGDEQEDEELLGGVHYSTYGGRTSVIYDSDTASPRQLYDGPFADVCVPVPDELKAQVEKNELARAEREREKEKGHKRRGSQVTAALLRKVGVESPPPEEDTDHQPRLRKRTLSSIMLPSALSQSQSSAPTSPPPIAAHPASQSHVTLGTGTEQTHGTTSQEDTTLISMSKFPMPPVESVPPTPGSMSTVMPGTPALPGARPTTPAVPDFLVASRSATPGPANTPTEGESSSSEAKPKLRTRASLLALAMRRDSSSGSPKTQSADSPKAEPGSVESSNSKPETPNTSRPDPPNTSRPDPPNTSKSDPRRRSMLERLAARLAGPSALGQDESWVDESFTSDLEDSEDLRRDRERVVSPVLDFNLPSEPLIDLEQFGMMLGSSSPVRDRVQASATFPPTGMRTTSASSPRVRTTSAGSPPSSPPFPRIRTLSKLSTTGRKVLNKLEGRPSNRRSMSVFSTGSRSSRKSRKKHRVSGESTRGRLGSITRRASADMLSAEGAVEGTVMYGVGEEMLRLMFGEGPSPIPSQLASPERERERTRSLPRRVSTPKRPVPRGDLVAARVHAVESENKAPGDVGLLPPDFGGSLDLRFSNPMANPPSTQTQPNVALAQAPVPLQPTGAPAPRRKGHRRGTASASKENVSIRPKSPVQLKSRTRSKSAPLGLSPELSKSLDAKPAVGILTNGGSGSGRTTPNLARGRVVIVNSATTPSFGAAMNTGTGAATGAATPRRQTTRSNPLAPAAAAVGNTSTGSQSLTQPGVVVTAPTPPAPRRSMSMPLDGMGEVPKVPDSTETPRGTMSRGTSVQFVPESYEGRRSGKRRERPSSLISSGPPVLEVLGNGSGNGNGKRKVEREPTDAADASMSSPFKKPKLSEEMDITFMGEPLFGGRPQHKRGVGSVDRASSHHSTYSRHSQSYRAPYPYPTPTTSPDPERASIPIHAIVTPRVQSLYGTGSEYASRRQSISSIPRPKSRASARSNATGRRSNMTGARSARSNRTSGSGKLGPRSWRDRLPMPGWCFLIGFLVPFAWWYAAFARAERGYYGGGIWSREVESQWEGVRTDVHRDDGRIDAYTWRFRCRLMAVVSIVVYVPVIVLAAVFA